MLYIQYIFIKCTHYIVYVIYIFIFIYAFIMYNINLYIIYNYMFIFPQISLYLNPCMAAMFPIKEFNINNM